MLLCEVVDPSKLNLHLKPADLDVGIKHINIVDDINPEERRAMEAIGVDLADLSPVSVVYGYILPFGPKGHSTTPEMDALKMRNGYSVDDVKQRVIDGATLFIKNLMVTNTDNKRSVSGRWAKTRAELRVIQNQLKSSPLVTIIVIPSSSPLPQMLADITANVLRSKGIQVKVMEKGMLEKVAPMLSRERLKDKPLGHKAIDYRGNETKLNALYHQLHNTDPSDPEAGRLHAIIKQTMADMEDGKAFQIKNTMRNAASDYGKAYYGWIKAHEGDISTDVILIDDNVVSGKTVADAVKSLVALHRKPLNVIGIALHHFGKVRKEAA